MKTIIIILSITCILALLILFYGIRAINITIRNIQSIKNRNMILHTKYNENNIMEHLDYLITEIIDQYIIFTLQPKNINYITNKIQVELTTTVADKVPEMISPTLIAQLEQIYNPAYVPEFIGNHIYMVVTNFVLDYNINNSPADNEANSITAMRKNKQ